MKIILSNKQKTRPLFRTFTTSASTSTESKSSEETVQKKSILQVENAIKHCTAEVKKFDFYAYANGQYMPKST